MIKEKAAIFIDNSNIYKGVINHARTLWKKGSLEKGKYLRLRWEKLIDLLEAQDCGIDIYSRHLFAAIRVPDLNRLYNRQDDDQLKQSTQYGYYKAIQEPPLNFQFHGIPLKCGERFCNSLVKNAFSKCIEANDGIRKSSCAINFDACNDCKLKYMEYYEKGVDVALATQLIISCSMNSAVPQRIIVVSGDGDYIEALRHVRQVMGKNVQIVSWKNSLSRDLEKVTNKPTIYLEEYWNQICEVKKEKQYAEEIAVAALDDEESI